MQKQPSSEEFEPFCKRIKGKQQDVLEVRLCDKDFRKEHLKATINNFGVLKIVGERPLDENKWRRFRKEFHTPTDCRRNKIRAKISNGIIYVTIPKKIPSGLQIAGNAALKLGSFATVVAVVAYVAYKYRQAAW